MAVGSFSAGLSGLSAHATALNVIGNNLANMNTVGFKASTVNFMDLVSQTMGGVSGITQIGLGVTTGSISAIFSQGSIENSGEATNVAIQGNGFFVVKGDSGIAYTRAGNFSFNANGELVTPDGFKVQGYSQIDPRDRAGRSPRASPPTSSCRQACCAPRCRRASSGSRRTSTRRRRSARRSPPSVPDLRFARRAARDDHHLHEDRQPGVELFDHGARRRGEPAASSRSARSWSRRAR